MSELLTREQIEQIAADASDYDHWVTNKRDPEHGPAYPIEPHTARSLCDMALRFLSPAREGWVSREDAAQCCDRLASMMEQGAGEPEPGGRLRQAARMIRDLSAAPEQQQPAQQQQEDSTAAIKCPTDFPSPKAVHPAAAQNVSPDRASGDSGTGRRNRTPIREMSLLELLRLRDRVNMQLHLRALGDPRKSVTMGATAPEAGQELKTASEPDMHTAVAPRPEKDEK